MRINSFSELSLDHLPSVSTRALRDARARLGTCGYLRVCNYFGQRFAETACVELSDELRYASHYVGAVESFGIERYWESSLSGVVGECCDLLTSSLFLRFLGALMDADLKVTRRPAPFRMKFGDSIVAHDDVSDYPTNCLSAVLHFSKDWKRTFGGNTVIGFVKRIEKVREDRAKSTRHWIFADRLWVLVPVFNSLVLIALRPGMAHKVTKVRIDRPRLTIAATYGFKDIPLSRGAL